MNYSATECEDGELTVGEVAELADAMHVVMGGLQHCVSVETVKCVNKVQFDDAMCGWHVFCKAP